MLVATERGQLISPEMLKKEFTVRLKLLSEYTRINYLHGYN